MPALENHTGLLMQTIPDFNRRSFVNISNKHRGYAFVPAIQRQMKRAIDSKWTKFQFGLSTETRSTGGTDFRFNVQVGASEGGSWVSDDDPVHVTRRDYQQQAVYPWRLFRAEPWSYSQWELAACRGKEELVSILVSRPLAHEQGMIDAMEKWSVSPPPPSTDDKTAFPIRYHLYTEPESTTGSYVNFTQINYGTANGNLLNVNHASYPNGPGGLSRATYRRLGNLNCQFTAFTEEDAIEKLTYACIATDWNHATTFPDAIKGPPERAIYTTMQNYLEKGRLARAQNDQNTSDLAARITDVDFFQIPFMNWPILDSEDFELYGGSNKRVIYGIDWTTWEWASRTGFNLEEKIFSPELGAPQHYTHVRWLGGQLVCMDPSRNFVLSL